MDLITLDKPFTMLENYLWQSHRVKMTNCSFKFLKLGLQLQGMEFILALRTHTATEFQETEITEPCFIDVCLYSVFLLKSRLQRFMSALCVVIISWKCVYYSLWPAVLSFQLVRYKLPFLREIKICCYALYWCYFSLAYFLNQQR